MNPILRTLGRFAKKNGPKAGKAYWKFQKATFWGMWKLSTGIVAGATKPPKKKKH